MIRADRWYQANRHALRRVRFYRALVPQLFDEEWGEWALRRFRRQAALCSCPMCGNPRKWFGQRTVQERRADIATRDQLREVGLW